MDAGLLPVKRLDLAKSRLEGFLDAGQRLELARAMLEDALDLCSAASGFLEWFVLSSDDHVLERAGDRGLRTLQDPADDLNASLRFAIENLGSGIDSVTIVPVDAPLATADELRDLFDTGALSDVVVVPAERDAGTNGLFLRPPDLLEPRFGASSFSAYVREAEALKLRCSILPLEGLSVDVDTIEDVERVLGDGEANARSIKLLREWAEARD